MGFKVNYHTEAMLLLCIMFILTVPANANIPDKNITRKLIQPIPSLEVTIPTIEEKIVPNIPQLNSKDLICLAEAVYFESNNEPINGQRAVAHVIVNRSLSSKFPSTVCKVINQKHRTTCQFSYKCSGKNLNINAKNLKTAMKVSQSVLNGAPDITKGALYFHNKRVKPAWAKPSKLTLTIANHKFYKG